MKKHLTTLAWLLVLANGLFWVWSHGGLRMLGWGPNDPREPQRVEEQLKPDAVRLLESNVNR